MRTAVNTLFDDEKEKFILLPPALLFVLYGSTWVRIGDGKQLHCFPWQHNFPRYQYYWQAELEARPVSEHIRQAVTDKNLPLQGRP